MNSRENIIEVSFDVEVVEEIFYKPSTNMSGNYCVPYYGHIPKMILARASVRVIIIVVQHLSDNSILIL